MHEHQARHRRPPRLTDHYERHGFPEQIVADRYVVQADRLSEVLLNSGIMRHGRAGEGFHVLGGVTVTGELSRKMDTFDGIGLTAIANASNEYVIESFFSPPGAFSVTAPGFFEEHATRMKKYAFAMQAGTMVGCAPRGRISLQGGRVKIDLTLSKDEVGLLKKGHQRYRARLFQGRRKSRVSVHLQADQLCQRRRPSSSRCPRPGPGGSAARVRTSARWQQHQ